MKTFKHILFGLLTVAILTAALAFTINPFQKEEQPPLNSIEYRINKSWELPKVLNEVSGIAWLSNGIIACVQDEDGIIFIYDLQQKKIIEEIDFSGSGDYEGIAIHKNDAYVMRSDGVLFEVLNFQNESKTIHKFETEFSAKNNIETLAIDIKNRCLLTAPKDRDKSDDFKGLYKIPLDSKRMDASPSVSINLKDDAFKSYQEKKAYKTFRPSDVAIHPKTGEYYVLEGVKPKLVILNRDGAIKKVYKLNKDTFSQPEGITFSPDGTLYISNESVDGPATILQVHFE